jgi:hypothetical protein
MLMNRSPLSAIGSLAAIGRDRPGLGGVRFGTALLLLALTAALAVRAYLAATSHFPINDGALFYEFVRGVAASFPGLPAFVAYNGLDVPFGYPPLSFWVGALLTRLGVAPLDVVQYLPIAMNAAYMLLFAGLLLRAGHSRLFSGIALLFLLATLRSFEWLVMGGGLSRGMGSLFLLLTLVAAGLPPAWSERDSERPRPARMVLAGLCIAGAILSHLEWGVLTTGAFVAARALGARDLRSFVRDQLIAGTVALLCIAPWVGSVVAVHGTGPFLAAGGTSQWNAVESALQIFSVGFNNRANPFFFLGLAALAARRELFWPIFILLCLFLTPRHSATPLVLPIAVISAHGVLAFVDLARKLRLSGVQSAIATAMLVALVLSWQVYRDRKWAGPFAPLAPATLDAMRWVRANAAGARFAVVTEHGWYYDASAEWFPTLAGARSVNTVQGREWLPDQAFARWKEMDVQLKSAASCPDMLRALRAFGPAEFVWAQHRIDCFRAALYRPVYRLGDVVIFQASGG